MRGEVQVHMAATTVVLHGELDLVTIEPLRELLDDAITPRPTRLVVDVRDVPFMDVLSLAAVLATCDAVRDVGGEAALRGANLSVRKICALLNADDVLMLDLPMQRSPAVV